MLRQFRILIVEDQPIIALSIQEMLLELNAKVVGMAQTLIEAVVQARSAEVNLALLDTWLQGQTSYSVGDILHERGIPFAVMSGGGGKDEPASFRNAPRLLKPFTRDELVHVLLPH